MTEIRSYRRVFDLERRIYSVDQLRLNPGGVPVRGVMYFLAILVMGLPAGSLPAVRSLVAELPWYVRDIALPGVAATVLSTIRVEGRTFHLAAQALVRYRLGPRRLADGRGCRTAEGVWRPCELVMLPDGSDSRLRRMCYTGPGAVLVCVAHQRTGRVVERGATGVARRGRRRAVTLRGLAPPRVTPRAHVISVGAGARLHVRSTRRSALERVSDEVDG
jgi:hypothetical protein